MKHDCNVDRPVLQEGKFVHYISCYQEKEDSPLILSCSDFDVEVKFCPRCGYSPKKEPDVSKS